jgi:c-di-GMP-related signal transduction protein
MSQQSLVEGSGALGIVVARQPITDREGRVVGFELLYRPQHAAHVDEVVSGEQMTATVVLGALAIGVLTLVGDKLMYCNADREVLIGNAPVSLPPERTVIEVLESVEIDDEIVAGCRALVASGYRLALDDFVWSEGAERLLELASVVKVDFLATTRDEIRVLVERCRAFGVQMLAEKVETAEDVSWAMDHGFDLFQGYAIERPQLVRSRGVVPARPVNLQLALTLLDTDLDLVRTEEVLRGEPGLVAQVLTLASVGAAQGLRRHPRSLREALILLGTRKIREWAALTLLTREQDGSPDAVGTAMVRARMVELLAPARGIAAPQVAFTAGLLSALDLVLGMPLDQLGHDVDLDPALVDAAFWRRGALGALIDEVDRYQCHLSRGSTPASAQEGASPAGFDATAAIAFAWAVPYLSSLDVAS